RSSARHRLTRGAAGPGESVTPADRGPLPTVCSQLFELLAFLGRRRRIDHEPIGIDDHAVVPKRTLQAHQLVEDVHPHQLRITLQRVTPAAAATAVEQDPLALRSRDGVGPGRDYLLIFPSEAHDRIVPASRATSAKAVKR